jgi:hypothetical protein
MPSMPFFEDTRVLYAQARAAPSRSPRCEDQSRGQNAAYLGHRAFTVNTPVFPTFRPKRLSYATHSQCYRKKRLLYNRPAGGPGPQVAWARPAQRRIGSAICAPFNCYGSQHLVRGTYSRFLTPAILNMPHFSPHRGKRYSATTRTMPQFDFWEHRTVRHGVMRQYSVAP